MLSGETRAGTNLPYFILGPTIGFNDSKKEQHLKQLTDYEANACIAFGHPKSATNLISAMRERGILAMEDAHYRKCSEPDRIRDGWVPFCMKGEYQRSWLKGLRDYVRASDVDAYCVTLDEVYWNNLFFGYGFGRKYCEDQPVYTFSEDFRDGFRAWCTNSEAIYATAIRAPDTGRTRIIKDNTVGGRRFILYRYKAFAQAMRERIAIVKEVRPDALAYVIFSAVPTFALERYPSGIAWDVVGETARPDLMVATAFQTFQDYRGKETHLCLTEAACHLVAGNRPRPAGIVMAIHDNCVVNSDHGVSWPAGDPSRYQKVEIRPVDVVGQALSYAAHGLRGVFCYSPGPVENPRGQWLFEVYQLLHDLEPLVARSHIPPVVAFVHSRGSEDFYALYHNSKRSMNADEDGTEAMRRVGGWAQPANRIAHDYNIDNAGSAGFRIQGALLHFLVKEAVPFEVFQIEELQEDEIKDFGVILLPFPFSISKNAAGLLDRLVTAGKNLIIYSAYGQTDEEGNYVAGRSGRSGRLMKLIGLTIGPPAVEQEQDLFFDETSPFLGKRRYRRLNLTGFFPLTGLSQGTKILARGDSGGIGVTCRKHGEGRVYYLGGDLGLRASEDGYGDINRAVLAHAIGEERGITLTRRRQADVEAAIREIDQTDRMLFLVNWESRDEKVSITIPLPDGEYVADTYLPSTRGVSNSQTIRARHHRLKVKRSLSSGQSQVIHVRKM